MLLPNEIYADCEKMITDEWGYIYGTSGRIWTRSAQNSATRPQTKAYGKQWIGHHVTDCSGMIYCIWQQHGCFIEHNANAIARQFCGEMTDTPQPGYAAFLWDEKPKRDGKGNYHHIGIVDADGKYVYEARSTYYGVTHDRPVEEFNRFAPFIDVDYEGTAYQEVEPYEAKTKAKLNIRLGPDTRYTRIGILNQGQKITVIATERGWSVLDYGGQHGYVNSRYLIT